MKRIQCILIIGLAAASAISVRGQEGNSALKLVQTITLSGVEGRIDHLAVDLKGKRLFVAALGNNTLEVIDLAAGRRIHTITGLKEPQGVAYVPEANRIVVANGQGDGCNVYDGGTYKFMYTKTHLPDSDNLRYVPSERVVYAGYGAGAIIAIPQRNDRIEEAGLTGPGEKLDGHPESFQIEMSGSRIFINVPDAREIEVLSRQTLHVTAKWPVTSAQANYPMALDEKNHRLFIGCRKPSKMLVYDTDSGKQVSEIGIAGDTDDLFYDAARKRIYVTCGEGWIDVIQQNNPNGYTLLGKQKTVPGARTSLFVPDFGRLYVACRKAEGNPAEIRVYEVDSRRSLAHSGRTDLSAVVLQNYGFHFLLP